MKIFLMLATLLTAFQTFAVTQVSCKYKPYKTPESNISVSFDRGQSFEMVDLGAILDGRKVVVAVEGSESQTPEALNILIYDRDVKGNSVRRRIKGDLSNGVTYQEESGNLDLGYSTISCKEQK